MQCPKCSYIRKPTDNNPDWQCPSCGIAYAKFKKAAAPPLQEPLPAEEAEAGDEPVVVYSEKRKKGLGFDATTIGGLLCLAGGAWLTYASIIEPYMAIAKGAREIHLLGFKA